LLQPVVHRPRFGLLARHLLLVELEGHLPSLRSLYRVGSVDEQ
jgi:hypothetical protein